MKKEIESLVLVNKEKQRLMVYHLEDSNNFCIGLEGEDHFIFSASDAEEIIEAINQVVDSFS